MGKMQMAFGAFCYECRPPLLKSALPDRVHQRSKLPVISLQDHFSKTLFFRSTASYSGLLFDLSPFHRSPPRFFFFSPGALTKVRDCPKQEGELHDRCNIISCATLAEIQHFHRTRVRDFRSQMQHHLRQQIVFFQKITAKLEDALQKYDDDQ